MRSKEQLLRYRDSSGGDENILELDHDDGSTTLNIL